MSNAKPPLICNVYLIAMNDNKMTLNITRSKSRPNMCHYCLQEFHSVSLYDQPFSADTPLLWQVHRPTPKWHWTLQGQMYYIWVLLVSFNPKFQSASLHEFVLHAILRQVQGSSPQMTLNTHALWGQRHSTYFLIRSTLEFQIQLQYISLRPAFFI